MPKPEKLSNKSILNIDNDGKTVERDSIFELEDPKTVDAPFEEIIDAETGEVIK